jgi:membrane protein YqaA with SNARE-associated domain
LLKFYRAMDKYEAFKSGFAQWGAWIIVLKGLTPIPFKLVTIASGAARFDLVAFTLASLVSRGLRVFRACRLVVAVRGADPR